MNNAHTIITKGFATAKGEGERIWFVADTLKLKATAASSHSGYQHWAKSSDGLGLDIPSL
jgi:hypothetical protein